MPTPRNLSVRLSDRAKPWVVKAIKEHGQEEAIVWELGLSAFPDPSTTVPPLGDDSVDPSEVPGLIPALTLYLELPTTDPTLTVYASPVFAPFTLKESTVNRIVKTTLEELRQFRLTATKPTS